MERSTKRRGPRIFLPCSLPSLWILNLNETIHLGKSEILPTSIPDTGPSDHCFSGLLRTCTSPRKITVLWVYKKLNDIYSMCHFVNLIQHCVLYPGTCKSTLFL